jgi:tetratricopeptide (TPR) repeat protein
MTRSVVQPALLLICGLLVSAHGHAQAPANLENWLVEPHRAVETYISGDTAGALRIFAERSEEAHRQIVEALRRTNRPAVWDARSLTALGALHMEAALDGYMRRGPTRDSHITYHLDAAETLFSLAAGASDQAPAARWELTIGLIMLAGGEYGWAETVLDRACRQFKDDVPLLVACGSLHEAMASAAADQHTGGTSSDPALRYRSDLPVRPNDVAGLLREFGRRQTSRSTAPLLLTIAQESRNKHIEAARQPLERALQLDSGNVEARIRLANIHREAHESSQAAALLDDVISGKLPSDPRQAYLARLVLGAIRERDGQLDAAAVLFDDASRRVPCSQSAVLALMRIARSKGDARIAADALDRLLQQPPNRDDPWWNYPFGQYWLPETLLKILRAEVRR